MHTGGAPSWWVATHLTTSHVGGLDWRATGGVETLGSPSLTDRSGRSAAVNRKLHFGLCFHVSGGDGGLGGGAPNELCRFLDEQ